VVKVFLVALYFWFSCQKLVCISLLSHSCYIPCSFLTSSFYYSNYTVSEYKLLTSSLCNFPRPPTVSPSWVQIFSSAPYEYSQIFSVCVLSLISHQYKTGDRIKYCVNSNGFRRWGITLGINGFLGFVHRPLL
jgi:hypothetical protein